MIKKITTMAIHALLVVGATLAASTALRADNWDFNDSGDFATSPEVGMVVSVMSGWGGQSAWTDRGDLAKSSAMTPIGDGTFQLRLDLVPGAQYNYMFWATGTVNTASQGFANGSVNSEPVPNSGNDMGTFFSLSSATYQLVSSGTPSIGYGSVGGDGRRLIRMPDVTPGTTVWVYNNYASTPGGVANTNVNVNESQVILTWAGGQGYWGAGTGAMDIIGGRVRIYVSSDAIGGPYGLTADLAGTTTKYTHSGLTAGVSYYFVFVTSDSYSGVTDPTAFSFYANLTRDRLGNPGQTLAANNYKPNAGNFNYNDLTGKPQTRTPTYFKVQGGDEEYILKHDSVVYLTPWEVDDPTYPFKTRATIAVGYVPPKRTN